MQENARCTSPHWTRSTLRKQPLPGMRGQWLSRWLTRGALLLRHRQVLGIDGAEHVDTGRDPFIFTANHGQRAEALVVPCLLAFLRGGQRVHFLADWNFALIPPVGLMYWCGGTIVLTRKPAKPRFLNVFRPLFERSTTGFERAAERLAQGDSVGIYPEGTVNRDPERLLRGHAGAARLSLETGTPVVPSGITYPGHPGPGPVPESAGMRIAFGAPLDPGPARPGASLADVRAWHANIMNEIARLSGKAWCTGATRR